MKFAVPLDGSAFEVVQDDALVRAQTEGELLVVAVGELDRASHYFSFTITALFFFDRRSGVLSGNRRLLNSVIVASIQGKNLSRKVSPYWTNKLRKRRYRATSSGVFKSNLT